MISDAGAFVLPFSRRIRHLLTKFTIFYLYLTGLIFKFGSIQQDAPPDKPREPHRVFSKIKQARIHLSVKPFVEPCRGFSCDVLIFTVQSGRCAAQFCQHPDSDCQHRRESVQNLTCQKIVPKVLDKQGGKRYNQSVKFNDRQKWY